MLNLSLRPEFRGKWESRGTDVPSDDDMVELFSHQPTVPIFDEFQTWFDGLTNTKQHPLSHGGFTLFETSVPFLRLRKP